MRVLFLSHRLPYAPNRGDRIRAFHLLHAMARFASVTLVSLVHDHEESLHADDLRSVTASTYVVPVSTLANRFRAVPALWSTTPLTHVLLDGPTLGRAIAAAATPAPDLVFAYGSGMARLALAAPLAGLPFVLDMVDVDSVKWAAFAAASRPPMRWIYAREARMLARFERDATRQARCTFVVSERERRALAALTPEGRIELVENGVDVASYAPPHGPAGEPVIVFTGVFSYQPNLDAARWLVTDVWPRVRVRHPAARLQLVGLGPPAGLRQLASGQPGVEVTGAVPDVRPYLWGAAAAAAPLFTALGTQNKVLEAVAAGLPTVITPRVLEGLPDEIRSACLVADTAEGFARQLIELLSRSPAARRQMAAGVNLEALSWERRLASLELLLKEATSPPAAAGGQPTKLASRSNTSW